MATNTILRAANFVDRIGVDTHLSYTDGLYNNVSAVIADLKYLGLSNVRDSLSLASHLSAFETVAASGVKFTLTIAGQTQTTSTLQTRLGLAASLLSATPGSVIAMEGVNEINKWPVTYNGLTGICAAVALQRDLYTNVHGSAAFAGVSVDYFTGYAAGGVPVGPNPYLTPGLADYDTQHPYPTNGQAPDRFINPANALPNETSGMGPAVYTETGYSSNGGTSGAVNQDVQAKYTLDLLCDALKYGIQRTYLYDLLDAYAPGSKQGDDGFGLFDYHNNPKEAAVAIHNLTSLLADPGANAQTFATGNFNPTFAGLPASGGDLVVEKSSGEYDIVVWAEPQIWDPTKGAELLAPTTNVTVNLGGQYQKVVEYDPLLGTTPIATYSNAATITVGVTDHPIVLEVFSSTALAASVKRH